MGRFATGVTIITTRLDDHVHGMTANAVTSLSLDPMLVLVCVDKTADTHDILARAGVFAVNILNRKQWELSNRFAKKEFDGAHGLEDVRHGFAVTGSPIIEGAIAYLDCRTAMEHHGGDHTIFIGEVLEAKELSEDAPLVFYRGKYGEFSASD
jgi:flavin reductase (DIM6/NTAB) family NADH-FMN oxidoreductase RutF